jgi:hypothetical protein
MKTIDYLLTKIGNLYYVLDREEPKPYQWAIQNKIIIACTSPLEACLQIDEEQIEDMLYENIAEQWVRKSLPHRIPHKKAFIQGYIKAIRDHKSEFKDRIIELEAEEISHSGLIGLTLKISNGKVNAISIK